MFIRQRIILPRRLSLMGWRFSRVTAKRRSQLRLLPSVRSRVRLSSSRNVHVQHPVHRLDAPVPAHRLAEPLAAQVPAQDVVPHLVRLAAVGVRGDPHRSSRSP